MRIVPMVLVCLALLAPLPAEAVPSHADDAFQNGVEHFRAGRYRAALTAFNEAREEGRDDPRLIYNLGVTHFKLAQYREAKRYFQRLLDYPGMASLASYNLGLVALREQRPQDAELWFEQTLQTAEGQLRDLAAQGLARARQMPLRAALQQFIEINAGYDTEVIGLQDQANFEIFGDEALFTEAIYGLSYDLGPGPWSFQGGFYALFFDEVADAQLTAANLYLLHERAYRNWALESRLGLTGVRFGGEAYQANPSLRFSAARSDWTLSYELTENIGLKERFENLDGQRHVADISYRHDRGNGFIEIGYSYELNDRRVEAFSPRRHQLEARLSVPVFHATDVIARLAWRHSDYDGTDARTERQTRGSLRLAHYLSRQWEIHGEYRLVDNNTRLETFAYTQNVFSVGIAHAF